ncbi:histone-lysine N-methyltransferase SETDB2 isoform X6 [Artibeus jamaicensis]|uniref:histone-lysine N-methyltransferase SETDB2 isoform X6 n=1 Tax=Artibeus jamaicensis TaxID=9417 RepID=UPI00235A4CB1|nr:histone-lysine N-methyltransferase SETDB2 isoform X6 [Artibeus jamaicensis]
MGERNEREGRGKERKRNIDVMCKIYINQLPLTCPQLRTWAHKPEYIQAMILVNEATRNNSSTLIKAHKSVTENEQKNKSHSWPSTSYEESFPEDCTVLTTKNKESPSLGNKAVDFGEKESSLNLSYQSHDCSGACLMKMPLTFTGENPLQLPITCHFQRRHAKTNTHSSALHLTRNYPKQEEIVSDLDISNGMELVPISFCNEVDNRKLPYFKYRKTMWPRAYYLSSFPNIFTDSCDCSEGCIDITKCACLQMTARNAEICPLSRDKITIGYKYKRLQRHIPTGIYECSLLCKCNRRMCQNRVVQHGPQVRLQVFKTEKKGWGVRCLDDIDRGTFVCTYSGRLLSRSNTEKPDAIGENRKEENTMKNVLSKRRKMEVADCEVEVIPLELDKSAKTEECPAKFKNNPKKPIIDMKCNNISRIRYHSAITTLKTKIAIIQPDGRKMGFASSESITSEGNDEFKSTQIHLTTKANDIKKCFLVNTSSNPVEDSEDKLLIESDVIDKTKCREETSLGGRYNEATTLDNQNIMKEFEVQILKPQEKKSPACQNQQVICGEELSGETKNTSSDSLKFSKGNVFLLDATKEGNVGRFLNHSCCPNLLVQNVFVETHDRNFPLVAFFTNRYVKARTELTWDYGYEAGTVPDKEILCQCGVNKCRKKIL